jgi:membrane-bound lytic murein transglycosylase MltF
MPSHAEIRKELAPAIQADLEQHFPALLLDFEHADLIIHAQIQQESGLNPLAESGCGARGLMQLMPATDKEIDGDYDGFDPAGNIDNGIRYMAFLYAKFSEIPDPQERIRFALAAYNCGRGYVNKAIAMARSLDGWPAEYSRWVRADRPDGRWQRWSFTKTFLDDPRCEVHGRRPDAKQVRDYIVKIMLGWRTYVAERESS